MTIFPRLCPWPPFEQNTPMPLLLGRFSVNHCIVGLSDFGSAAGEGDSGAGINMMTLQAKGLNNCRCGFYKAVEQGVVSRSLQSYGGGPARSVRESFSKALRGHHPCVCKRLSAVGA